MGCFRSHKFDLYANIGNEQYLDLSVDQEITLVKNRSTLIKRFHETFGAENYNTNDFALLGFDICYLKYMDNVSSEYADSLIQIIVDEVQAILNNQRVKSVKKGENIPELQLYRVGGDEFQIFIKGGDLKKTKTLALELNQVIQNELSKILVLLRSYGQNDGSFREFLGIEETASVAKTYLCTCKVKTDLIIVKASQNALSNEDILKFKKDFKENQNLQEIINKVSLPIDLKAQNPSQYEGLEKAKEVSGEYASLWFEEQQKVLNVDGINIVENISDVSDPKYINKLRKTYGFLDDSKKNVILEQNKVFNSTLGSIDPLLCQKTISKITFLKQQNVECFATFEIKPKPFNIINYNDGDSLIQYLWIGIFDGLKKYLNEIGEVGSFDLLKNKLQIVCAGPVITLFTTDTDPKIKTLLKGFTDQLKSISGEFSFTDGVEIELPVGASYKQARQSKKISSEYLTWANTIENFDSTDPDPILSIEKAYIEALYESDMNWYENNITRVVKFFKEISKYISDVDLNSAKEFLLNSLIADSNFVYLEQLAEKYNLNSDIRVKLISFALEWNKFYGSNSFEKYTLNQIKQIDEVWKNDTVTNTYQFTKLIKEIKTNLRSSVTIKPDVEDEQLVYEYAKNILEAASESFKLIKNSEINLNQDQSVTLFKYFNLLVSSMMNEYVPSWNDVEKIEKSTVKFKSNHENMQLNEGEFYIDDQGCLISGYVLDGNLLRSRICTGPSYRVRIIDQDRILQEV